MNRLPSHGTAAGVGAALGVILATLDKRYQWNLGPDFWSAALLVGFTLAGVLPSYIASLWAAFHGKDPQASATQINAHGGVQTVVTSETQTDTKG